MGGHAQALLQEALRQLGTALTGPLAFSVQPLHDIGVKAN
jgi:hypothetical protein